MKFKPENFKGRDYLGECERKRLDNIKLDLKETGYKLCIGLNWMTIECSGSIL
jgi:hypothetical protein